MKNQHHDPPKDSRRDFIKNGSLLIAGSGIIGLSAMTTACNSETSGNHEEDEDEEKVSPNEDLMREHGLLQRMLLIYDTAIMRMKNGVDFDPQHINQTAQIIHDFIEEYHEKLEEDHVFPRLENANRLTGLTSTLRRQHKAGRKVTGRILQLTGNGKSPDNEEQSELTGLMNAFNIMYRPHEAREDTVLFPAFKEILSENEYDALGEDFEKIEHQKFGQDGFFMVLDKVAAIEKQTGIYQLDQFTPQV